MPEGYHRLVLVFADGVGLAPAGPDNPLSTTPTPALDRLLGGSLTAERVGRGRGWVLAALDACLGVEGLPQSVTGQASLFTGKNAAAALGRHVTGFVGAATRRLVEERSLLARAVALGVRVTFANAYGRPSAGAGGRRRPKSVTTLAAEAAGLALRTVDDLAAGRAVAWDITRERFRRRVDPPVEVVSAAVAGRHLAAVALDHDLTLFETVLTDLAGHRRFGIEPAAAVERLDGFLGGLLDGVGGGATLLLTSDHGNLEDATTRLHTRHPVPLLAVGPAAERFAGSTSLLEVTPRILEVLAAGATGR